jgi:hypothetical protein
MRITKISIRDYLGIGVFKIDKLGKLNRITGGNGVGKSAVIKAIIEAFKSSGIDPNLIRVNTENAEIIIELDEKILIQRLITPTSNSVKVVSEGQPLNSPQRWLNSILGPFNFNPVDFFLAKPKDRRQILLSAIPFYLDQEALGKVLDNGHQNAIDLSRFDFTKHGLEVLSDLQKEIYDRRHEQGLEVTRLKKAIEQDRLDIPETFDSKKFEGFDLQSKIDKLTEYNKFISQHKYDLDTLQANRIRAEQIVYEIRRLNKELGEIQTQGKALREKTDKFVRPDIESLQAEIREYQQSQKLIHKIEEIGRKEEELKKSDTIHKELEKLYKALTTEIPRKLLAQVKLPIDGLEIKGDDIFINGVAIEKLSTSEQIKFAVQIARALAGQLKVICVDRFESLDEDSRKLFEQEAGVDDFEYFMTVVTNGDLNLEALEPPKSPQVERAVKNKAGF